MIICRVRFILLCFILSTYGILFCSLLRAEEEPMRLVHINEFIPNPVGDDSKLEFIELFNNSSQSVDISSWIIDTGGSARFSIDAGTVLLPGGYLTFFSADKNISLTNSGDHIKLIRADSVVQDDITYISSKEGYSYNQSDSGVYQESSTPTPNMLNIFPASPMPIVPTPTASPTALATLSPTPTAGSIKYSDDVHISEFLPNPIGDDGDLEFVELHNGSSVAVNLSGWIIDTGPTSRFLIPPNTSIDAEGYLAFFSSSYDISLSNSSDHIQFIRPDGVVVDDISYSSSKEGYSYNRADTGVYEESFTPTPNASNSISSPPMPTPQPTSSATPSPEAAYELSSHIVINELVPNPKGEDGKFEFIEIKNIDTTAIHLVGWSLDDAQKGGAYHFSQDASIGSQKIAAFYREKTKITLNNTVDTVNLIDPNGSVVSSVSYKISGLEGQSFSRDIKGHYVWSDIVTPGKENIIHVQEDLIVPSIVQAIPGATKEKISHSDKNTFRQIPTVLGTRTEKLPWKEIVSRNVVFSRPFFDEQGGKKQLFILFGGTMAFLQCVSGISRKEAIWRRL